MTRDGSADSGANRRGVGRGGRSCRDLMRDTLNLIHELRERGVGGRNLAESIRIDSANPEIAPDGQAFGGTDRVYRKRPSGLRSAISLICLVS
jgi:hypothetical protein